jgi:Acetyltransferase (GNAT) domain
LTPIFKTVFHEPWWLEAASGGGWAEASVTSGGAVIARLPYVIKRPLGMTGIGMPALTHVLGPQLPLQLDQPDWHGPTQRELLTELFSQLPPHKYFSQICDPSFTHALPLYALGYDSSLQYTLRIAPAPEEEMMHGIRRRIRDDIRKAERLFHLDPGLGIDEFCRFYNLWTQTNNGQWWSQRYARQADAVKIRIHGASLKAGAGCLLGARDHNGVLRAAIMLLWDDTVMYYLLTTHSATAEGAGSVKFLIWEAMRIASRRGLIFDLDGFPRPNAVNILTGFGGAVRNRIAVQKIPPVLQFARFVASRSRFGL